MKYTKLFTTLLVLRPEQFRSFEKFLDSIYFTQKPDLKRLFIQLKPLLSSSNQNDLSREEVFEGLYPGKEFDLARMNKLQTQLNAKVLEFLAIHQFQSDKGIQLVQRLEFLNQRKDPVLWSGEFKRAQDWFRLQFPNAQNLHRRLLVQIEEARHNLRRATRRPEPIFNNALELLDEYYWLQKLKLTCAAINMDAILGTQHLQKELEDIPSGILDKPLPKIYYQVYMVLTHKSINSAFQALIKTFHHNQDGLPSDSFREPIRYLINFYLRQINSGDQSLLKKTGQLYANLISWLEKDKTEQFEPGDLKNYVTILLRLNDLPKAEQVLGDYVGRLSSDLDGCLPLYLEALIEFSRKEYLLAKTKINVLLDKTDHVFLQLDGRVLQWKTFYHLGETEPDLFDLASFTYHDTFRNYVRRSRGTSDSHKMNYKNFANLFVKLIKVSAGGEKGKEKRLLRLRDRILATDHTANRQWLLKQCEKELRSFGWGE